jgi:hypothetical protein
VDQYAEGLGPADLTLCGFSLWVHGAPPDPEPWADWLQVTAHCAAAGASVWTDGEVLMRGELTNWLQELNALYATLSGTARLHPVEPNLGVLVTVDRTGHLTVTVKITPDAFTQRHRFIFEADQSYLPAVLQQGHTLLRRLDGTG